MCILIIFVGVHQNHIGSDYDLERIIDDWILMGFLVGNDFIPHLPHLHINHDALPLLYKTYISVLPSLGGKTRMRTHTQTHTLAVGTWGHYRHINNHFILQYDWVMLRNLMWRL